MKEIRKLKSINHAASEMLIRMRDLEDKEDRCALLLELGEWVFMDITIEDELFIPNWEEVKHEG
tara:strand:- start:858 stop:1049 length:192 start_codon:yes stop_codon:yes gene_type:complete